MCGIFGAFNLRHLARNEREAISDLGYLSAFRGLHSTGLTAVLKKKPKSEPRYVTRTDAVNPVTFFSSSETQEQLLLSHATAFLGHARHATTGEINVRNAHPIVEGNIIGTHNGVVNKYRPDHKDLEHTTDSRVFFRMIDRHGLDKAVHDLNFTDSFALAYVNVKDHTINFVRNDKRPLHLARTKGGTWFWCSDPLMLAMAFKRNGLEADDEIISLKPEHLWSCSLVKSEQSINRPLEKPKYVSPYVSSIAERVASTFSKPKETPKVVAMKPGAIDDEIPWKNAWEKDVDPNVSYRIREGGQSTWISLLRAEDLLSGGCAYCGGKSNTSDTVYWLSPTEHICEECHDNDQGFLKHYFKEFDCAIKSELSHEAA